MLMYDLRLAWKNVRSRPIQSFITVLVIALALALPITVLALGDGLREGIVIASDPFGVLVVGAEGSSQQLVVNTVLLQDVPVGNIPYAYYDNLRNDPRTTLVVPLAMGDNIGGAPIIGTTLDFFELRANANDPPAFQIAEGQGRLFADDFEAVLGSRAAEETGLNVGDSFRGQHGVMEGLPSDVHDDVYTVVGILEPSHTAYDTAVYVTLKSVWAVHEDHDTEAGHDEDEAAFDYPRPILEDPQTAGEDRVTAILVKPRGYIEANQIWQEYYNDPEAQAAFPGQELGELFDLLEEGENLLQVVGYLVLAIAALTVFLSIYSATVAQEQSIAVMRGLGGSRRTVFRVVFFETILLTLVGTLLSRGIGYGFAVVIGGVVEQQSAIPIPIRYLPDLEPILWLSTLGLALLGGIIPALLAYRVNVIDKLFPT